MSTIRLNSTSIVQYTIATPPSRKPSLLSTEFTKKPPALRECGKWFPPRSIPSIGERRGTKERNHRQNRHPQRMPIENDAFRQPPSPAPCE